MNVLGVISGALKLVNVVARMFSRRQLMRAGASEAAAESQKRTLETVKLAKGVTHLVGHDSDYRKRLQERFRRTH